MKKVKLKTKNTKVFDQGTVIIQTPLHLSKFPLPKTSIFKISETLQRSQISYPPYPSRQICWEHRALACAKDCAQHIYKGTLVSEVSLDFSPHERAAKRRERKTSGYFGLESHFHADARVRIRPSGLQTRKPI